MTLRSRWKTLVTVAVLAVSTVVPAATASGDPSHPTKTYEIPGLERPVDMVVDKWGVPHIFASNTGDLFQAQGFNAARDRLFQIDTWRRRGLGILSEVLGPDYLEQDAAARMFLYRGDMAAEWRSYGHEAKLAATEFAQGINAYIDSLAADPDALPLEFRELGYQPAHWQPEDVVRIRSHAINENIGWEVTRAKLACQAGVGSNKYLRKLRPDHVPVVPDGLDPCAIPDDVLDSYNLGTAAVSYRDGVVSTETDKAIADTTTGSNSWAVSGERTATGRPIFSSDPHRGSDTLPSGRYIAHLSAPGFDLIGAGEPWNPGVAIGHSDKIAFGLTVFPADQTDLYVYELDPSDHTRYRYNGGWEDMTVQHESIPVAGASPQATDLAFTRHGPVIKVDEQNHRAYVIRSVWSEPGTSPYLGSLNFQRAGDFTEFSTAMRAWKTPGENLVYADTKGDIGWVPGALTPSRTGAGYDGLLPVPGDGRYEWNGFYDSEDLPSAHNPEAGFFASANDYNFPPDYPVTATYEWQLPYRKQLLDAALTGQPKHTVEDTLTLQKDEKSLVATQILPYLANLSSTDPATAKALELLRGYDGVAHENSAPAALFETWLMLYLHSGWARHMLPPEAADTLIRAINPDFQLVIESFAKPDEWFGPGGAAARDKLITDTLPLAFEDVSAKLGSDTTAWKWGAVHTQNFKHPLNGPDVGPIPRGGTYHTIHPSFYNPMTGEEVIGATFKMALDVGDWDKSRAINAPGQSGDQRNPHYSDLANTWASGGSFPLLYSRDAVEQNVNSRIKLEPAS